MIGTILLIAAFQSYWVNRLYHEERVNLDREADVLFRDVVYQLQMERFKKDSAFFLKDMPGNLFALNVLDSARKKIVDSGFQASTRDKGGHFFIAINRSVRTDSGEGRPMEGAVFFGKGDSFHPPPLPEDAAPHTIRYFSTNGKLNDSLPVNKLEAAYKKELEKNRIIVPFTIKVVQGKGVDLKKTGRPGQLKTNVSFVGLSDAYAYQADFSNPFPYIIGKIKYQLLFSFLLVALTVLSFVFLYRNLLAQRRLSGIRNEFISNITHELKTPIATVQVAIEALQNFNALESPEKTKEYLDISASETRRLSMLVDKVLRLSLFEHKAIRLNKEWFDLGALCAEVVGTMQLQSKEKQAEIGLETIPADFRVHADRLHLTSVLYNLIDNALKYSREKVRIQVILERKGDIILLAVADNGPGIPPAYRQKIFDPFFRVPQNDTHDSKGYGLGLSYVRTIIQRHLGFITVQSDPAEGSRFTIHLPVEEKPVIDFGEGRIARRKFMLIKSKRPS